MKQHTIGAHNLIEPTKLAQNFWIKIGPDLVGSIKFAGCIMWTPICYFIFRTKFQWMDSCKSITYNSFHLIFFDKIKRKFSHQIIVHLCYFFQHQVQSLRRFSKWKNAFLEFSFFKDLERCLNCFCHTVRRRRYGLKCLWKW